MSVTPTPVTTSTKWYLSKTLIVGALEVVIGVCGLLIPFFQTAAYTPAAFTALIAGVLTIVLRLITSDPISS